MTTVTSLEDKYFKYAILAIFGGFVCMGAAYFWALPKMLLSRDQFWPGVCSIFCFFGILLIYTAWIMAKQGKEARLFGLLFTLCLCLLSCAELVGIEAFIGAVFFSLIINGVIALAVYSITRPFTSGGSNV